MESTEPRLGFTLNRACRSFSRNSFLFLLESLPPSGLPELYMVAILLSRMNRILLHLILCPRSILALEGVSLQILHPWRKDSYRMQKLLMTSDLS